MGANSLNTEDYMYLINNRDIITTCQEALRENDLTFPSAILSDELITDQSSDAKSTSTGTCSTAEKSPEGTGATVTDYADWIKRVEKELDNVCYCNISTTKSVPSETSEGHKMTKTDANNSVTSESDFAAGVDTLMSSTPIKKDATSQLKHQVWRPVVERHRAIQAEVRSVGLRFKSILQDIANKKDATPSSGKQLRVLESRWHKLWLRSLESLMLIEECKCPNHLSGREKLPSSSISSSSTGTSTSNNTSTCATSTPKDRVRRQVLDQLEKISSPGVELTATPSSQQTSGFYSSSSLLLTSPTQLQQEQEPPSSGSSDQTSVKKEKPLKTSTSTSFTSGDFGSELISVKNRRVQTMGGQDLQDMKDSKFEVIQKDIGYSSDADMSDAYDARPQTDYINLSTSRNSSQRKRQFRRRQRNFQRLSPSCSTGNLDLSLICQGRNRPWSFHASSEWTDSWDYYIPPSSIHPQSSEDLSSSSPYDDDDTVRRITEFGENYEYWLKPDDVIIGLRDAIHRPPPPPLSILTGTDVGSSGEAHLSPKKEVSTMTSSTTPVEKSNDEMNKKRRSRKAYAIFVTFSLVSILLSLLFTSSYPPHLDLEYKSPPPL